MLEPPADITDFVEELTRVSRVQKLDAITQGVIDKAHKKLKGLVHYQSNPFKLYGRNGKGDASGTWDWL
ncbi:hypothetical protein V7147_07250 [Bacillus sp. JJ1521]